MPLASLLNIAEWFEAGMLICFGISWPISVLRSYRTKFVRGKSPAFMYMILLGYLSGTTYKLLQAAASNGWPQWTISLYILNALLVGVDIYFYYLYRHNMEPATALVHAHIRHLTKEKQESS